MSYLLTHWRYLRAHETPPSEDPPGETTVPGEQQGASGQSANVLSRDEFDQFRQSVTERFDGIGREVSEGFGWVRENLAPTISPADDVVLDSQSESQDNPAETVIEVQDRQTVRNRKPRARLNLGNLFR